MMTIDRLEELHTLTGQFAKTAVDAGYDSTVVNFAADIRSLIDAEIERQSVRDEQKRARSEPASIDPSDDDIICFADIMKTEKPSRESIETAICVLGEEIEDIEIDLKENLHSDNFVQSMDERIDSVNSVINWLREEQELERERGKRD